MSELGAAALAPIIAAIGTPDFMAVTANALASPLDFEGVTFFHHDGRSATPLFANLSGGVDAYARHTFRHNPMLAAGEGAFRAQDFFRPDLARGARHVILSPVEELGFRTPGWPEKLEEIGLYMHALGGVVELSFYRGRGRARARRETLRRLLALKAPLAAAFERHMTLRAATLPLDRLTAREQDVVRLIQAGHGSPAIAMRLGISRHTVKDHRKAIFRKLGIASQHALFRAG